VKSSTGKIEHEYHLVEELPHIANGRDITLHHACFAIAMIWIHQLD
jgi:hypothetical protein